MKLFSQNAKMRKTADAHKIDLYNFGIPAFMSTTGLKTCPNAASCVKGCYARQGAYQWSNVSQAYEARLAVTLQDDAASVIGAEIESLLTKATKRGRRLVLRIHDSGDFYSSSYQLMWYHVAKAFPEVTFYAYTKQVAQSLGLETARPVNFELIFSQGGKQDKYISPKMRHARVFASATELTQNGYIDASNDDMLALSPNHRVGLVYHGALGYAKTNWSNVTKEAL